MHSSHLIASSFTQMQADSTVWKGIADKAIILFLTDRKANVVYVCSNTINGSFHEILSALPMQTKPNTSSRFSDTLFIMSNLAILHIFYLTIYKRSQPDIVLISAARQQTMQRQCHGPSRSNPRMQGKPTSSSQPSRRKRKEKKVPPFSFNCEHFAHSNTHKYACFLATRDSRLAANFNKKYYL